MNDSRGDEGRETAPRYYENILATVGNTPARPSEQGHSRPGAARPGQARILQPGQEQQGPGRDLHRRDGRKGRDAPARRHDRRGHVREYRARARPRGPGQGLQVHLRDAGQGRAGEAGSPPGARRKGRDHADRRAARVARAVHRGREASRQRDPRRLPREPVLQSRTIRRSTTGRPVPRSGGTRAGASPATSPPSVPAARRAERAAISRSRTPRIRVIAAEPVGSILGEYQRTGKLVESASVSRRGNRTGDHPGQRPLPVHRRDPDRERPRVVPFHAPPLPRGRDLRRAARPARPWPPRSAWPGG